MQLTNNMLYRIWIVGVALSAFAMLCVAPLAIVLSGSGIGVAIMVGGAVLFMFLAIAAWVKVAW